MKRTEYYNSQEELNNYYPDGIPSTVLAIVKGEEGKSVLFTTSNNESAAGTMEDQGGYNIDEDTQEKIEVSYEFATDTGASKSYVADYVSTYGGGETPDLSAYVSKVELSNCGYITAQDVPAPDLSDYVSYSYLADQHYLKVQAQADWSVESSISAAYIRNKPDLSAYVSKTELEGMSYATESYVSSNYWEQPYGITIIDNNDIRFGHNASQFETANARITPSAWGLRILGDSSSKKIQLGYVGKNNVVEIGINVTFNYDNVYLNGVGNYDGTNQANAYTLAYVINEIQTTLGTAASVAEAIVGE